VRTIFSTKITFRFHSIFFPSLYQIIAKFLGVFIEQMNDAEAPLETVFLGSILKLGCWGTKM